MTIDMMISLRSSTRRPCPWPTTPDAVERRRGPSLVPARRSCQKQTVLIADELLDECARPGKLVRAKSQLDATGGGPSEVTQFGGVGDFDIQPSVPSRPRQ